MIKQKDAIEQLIQDCRDKTVLTQSEFDGLDPRITHIAYDSDGAKFGYIGEPIAFEHSGCWSNIRNNDFLEDLGFVDFIGDWQKSLIKRK